MLTKNTLALGLLQSIRTKTVDLDGTTATEITTSDSKITYIPYAESDFYYCWAADAAAAAAIFAGVGQEYARAQSPAEFWHYQESRNLYILRVEAGTDTDGLSYEQVG